MYTYLDKVLFLYPNIQHVSYWGAKYDGTVWNDLYDGLVWENTDIVKPTKAQLDSISEADIDKSKYKELREKEYPSIQDIVVALIEKEEGRPEALEALKTLRAAIKIKYPKTSNK